MVAITRSNIRAIDLPILLHIAGFFPYRCFGHVNDDYRLALKLKDKNLDSLWGLDEFASSLRSTRLDRLSVNIYGMKTTALAYAKDYDASRRVGERRNRFGSFLGDATAGALELIFGKVSSRHPHFINGGNKFLLVCDVHERPFLTFRMSLV